MRRQSMQRVDFTARTVSAWATVAVVAALVGGCQSTTSNPNSDRTPAAVGVAMQHPLLPNFPVPAGFEMNHSNSKVRKIGNMRIALCQFEGDLDRNEVIRFFDHYLPTANFKKHEENFNNGETILRYESPIESCEIAVRTTWLGTTIFVVDLRPLPGATPTGPPAPASGEPKTNNEPY